MQRQKKKMGENGGNSKNEPLRFEDKDLLVKLVGSKKPTLRSVSVDRKKINRPF